MYTYIYTYNPSYIYITPISSIPHCPYLRSFIVNYGECNGNPLQYSCRENPMDGEPGGLSSMGLHRVRRDRSNLAAAAAA